jgi:mannose-6-phosphate isomerase-like protein (cupin superfamily)
VKLRGEFTWHRHADTDEFFLVLGGRLTIQMPDRDAVLGPRELFVVPRGVEHGPRADAETAVLLFEPGTVINTGRCRRRTDCRGRGTRLSVCACGTGR